MIFNSLDYLVFLPIVFLLYWLVFQKNLKLQNLFIVVASYVFYGWWDWHFLILIAFTSLCSYLSGLAINMQQKKGGEKNHNYAKFWCAANIVLNLIILGVYKYYDFFVESFVRAFASIGITIQLHSLKLILPVGISFYTFQALSYTIDVYRKRIEPTKDIVSFFAFISFFPQLVAGPIERATNLLPQFHKQRHFDYNQGVDGMRLIVWGLFKKMVVADTCAIAVNEIWNSYNNLNSFTLISAAVFFAFQIYGDFSGYSDIAIGSAKLFGFELKKNFRLPYFSISIPDFWKRWHISLNTWFVDYLYIPLGGSRCVRWKVIRNTFIIFLVSGLWHGANFTFVCWGAYHALLFVPFLVMGKNKVKDDIDTMTWQKFFKIFVTFCLVVIGWVIFRSETIVEAFGYLKCMFTQFDIPYIGFYNINYLLIIALLILEWLSRKYDTPFILVSKINNCIIRWAVHIIAVLLVLFFASPSQEFIYFQF